MNTTKWTILCFIALATASCNKSNKTFHLKSIRLNAYRVAQLPSQNLYLKIRDEDTAVIRAHTGVYPSRLSLPAVFAVQPTVEMLLYKKNYHFQLWGDVSGYLGGCETDMKEYKIIFPIDMEVKNDSLNISITGSW